jgi:uncharacterized membrane protein
MSKMMMAAFDNQADADRALMDLEGHGYKPDDISVISQDNKYEGDGYTTGNDVAKGATSGAATGGVIGGLAGLLAGTGVFPALAGLFIGGPIAAALGLAGAAAATASGAVTGAAAGGLIGALTSLGLSKDSAHRYDKTVRSGGVVLGLSCDESRMDEARQTLQACGAEDIQMVQTREMEADHAHDSDHVEHRQARPEPAFGERREVIRENDDMTDAQMREDMPQTDMRDVRRDDRYDT